MKYSKFITDSLSSAAEIARQNFGRGNSRIKQDDPTQVVTDTDLEIARMLAERIQRKFPSHNIIDEELGAINKGSDFTWVIDPVDGTSNFSVGLPMYGIAMGLMVNFEPVAGGIAIPEWGYIYQAEKSKGAFLNGGRIRIPHSKKLSNCLVAYGIDANHKEPGTTEKECTLLARLILNIRNLRASNSMFDTAMLLSGKYGAYLNRHSMIWDNVAQHIIVLEAGGKYTDFEGAVPDYKRCFENPPENYSFIACSAPLLPQLLSIMY